MTELELAKIITSTENTPELGDYWANRYQKFLKEKSFIISDKTIQAIVDKTICTAPTTPFGHIDLARFVSKNKTVDEIQLQNTIETAVRFLDSALDIINFSAEARTIVDQYRKIGVGVINFREYLNLRISSSEIDEIDYLGNIISSSAYRASEALAEEKGTCNNWDFIKLYIRPKAFEYWYNINTGEVKNGLDVSEEYTPNNIMSNGYEIIPRRNSNIMLYPSELEWQIWSDRDESVARVEAVASTKVDVQVENKNLNTILNPNISSSVLEPALSNLNSINNQIKTNNTEIGNQTNNQTASKVEQNIPDIQTIQDTKYIYVSEYEKENRNKNIKEETASEPNPHPLTTLQNKLTSWFTPKVDLKTDFKPDITIKAQESHLDDFDKLDKPNINNRQGAPAEISSLATSQINNPSNFNKSSFLPSLTNFGIGDIVRVINEQSPLFGQYFQIADIDLDDNHYQITLKHQDQIICKESELIECDIKDVIKAVTEEAIDKTKQDFKPEIITNTVIEKVIQKTYIPIKLQAVILSSDGQHVLVQKNTDSQLPTADYNLDLDPEKTLSQVLLDQYLLNTEFLEISNINIDSSSVDEKILNIIYQIRVKDWDESNSNLDWQQIDQIENEYTYSVLDKSMSRIRRWQQSAKLKANKIIEAQTDKDKLAIKTQIKDQIESGLRLELTEQLTEQLTGELTKSLTIQLTDQISQKFERELKIKSNLGSEPKLEPERNAEPTISTSSTTNPATITAPTNLPSDMPDIISTSPISEGIQNKLQASLLDLNKPKDIKVIGADDTSNASGVTTQEIENKDDQHAKFVETRNKLFQPTVVFDNSEVVSVIVKTHINKPNSHQSDPNQEVKSKEVEQKTVNSTLAKLRKIQGR